MATVNRRGDPRTRKRVACELFADGSRHSGIVLDISKRGLFVQTSARPKPGTAVEVVLKLPGAESTLRLAARVARNKVVPAQLMAVAQGGVGLRVLDPPPEFSAFLARAEAGDRLEDCAPETVSAPRRPRRASGGKRTRYRVTVCRLDGGEETEYVMAASSEDAAGDRVLRDLGEGWKVARVEPA